MDDVERKSPGGKDDSHSQETTKESGLGNVVADHYNKLQERGLEERSLSRIYFMRNLNNWMKSYLISTFINKVKQNTQSNHQISVLDLGCGKGGDLLKWEKGGISHLICADIAGTSVEQCQERYKTLIQRKQSRRMFSAEFIQADCTKVQLKKLYKNPDIKLDIVSCQFTFHYSFESLGQAETMVRNAAECLRPGGFFIATIPNAAEIMVRLKRTESGKIENEVCKVEFPEDRPDPPPLFGDKYDFFLEGVVNCPEFLVHFPTLQRICSKYGLELVYRRQFHGMMGDGQQDEECRRLLSRMSALERFPAASSNSLSTSSPGEYKHAEDYLSEHSDVNHVGTLSKSEWDAATLYMGIAFKKSEAE